MQKRDSKSFDSGSLYRPELDDDSNGTSSGERIERIDRIERTDRSDGKIMLPTPPIRKSPAQAVTTPTTASGISTPNQSGDHSNLIGDRNETDTNITELTSDNKSESEEKPIASTEVQNSE